MQNKKKLYQLLIMKKFQNQTSFWVISLWILIWQIKEIPLELLHFDGNFRICEKKYIKITSLKSKYNLIITM